jgi:hypothetical protein
LTSIDGREALFEHIEIDVSDWANVHRLEIVGASFEGAPVNDVMRQSDIVTLPRR